MMLPGTVSDRSNLEAEAVTLRPSAARHGVVVMAILLAIVCYTDRVIIAQAAPEIRRDLALSEVQMGWCFAVFSWAYALFEMPGGWMGDRWGARKVLLRVVAWWSFFTAVTGWVTSYASLLVCRFLFGAGEAGCFPNIAKTFATWLPGTERVRAQGLMWFSARWGGAVTPVLVAGMLAVMPWRVVFTLFGGLGLVWVAAFAWWYRDRPSDHPWVNAAELALLPDVPARLDDRERVPWKTILGNRSIWLLWIQYFLISYSWWFYITWLPTYLREGRGYELPEQKLAAAMLAGVPLFFGGVGCWLGGQFLLPALARIIKSPIVARRAVGVGGLLASAVMLLVSLKCQDPLAAMTAMGLASFACDLTVPAAWAACMDMGGRYAGTIGGGMNMLGAFGGSLAGLSVGYLLRFTNQNWDVPIAASALKYFLGALCWLKLDPVTPLPFGPPISDQRRSA